MSTKLDVRRRHNGDVNNDDDAVSRLNCRHKVDADLSLDFDAKDLLLQEKTKAKQGSRVQGRVERGGGGGHAHFGHCGGNLP